MRNLQIRNIKIEEREGSVAHLKGLLRQKLVNEGEWIVLKAVNLDNKKEVVFPANVRDNFRVNIRKSTRSRLGLHFNKKVPVKFEIIMKLDRIKLRNERICFLSNSLIKVLPNHVKVDGEVIALNCYEWQKDYVILSYKNSKSSNYIVMKKKFCFNPFIVGLWRAEGGKYSMTSELQITNSNPAIIERWLSFINYLGFSKRDPRLFYYIQYIAPQRDGEKEKLLRRYWSERLNLPENAFGWIYKVGMGNESKQFGTLQVKFNNSTLSFVIQYLFLKFENSFLLKTKNKCIVADYIKGTLCDADCVIRNGSTKNVRFAASCEEEAKFYRKVLFKHFNIYSRISPDPRNKCFYVKIGSWVNLLGFFSYNLFNSISWKGNNSNCERFRNGMSNHLYSRIMLCFNSKKISIDKIVNLLLNHYNRNPKYAVATLIRRGIDYLVLNGFLVKGKSKVRATLKGLEAINDLSELCALRPSA